MTEPKPILQTRQQYEDYAKENVLTGSGVANCGCYRHKIMHTRAMRFQDFKDWEVEVWTKWLMLSFFTNTPDLSLVLSGKDHSIQLLYARPQDHESIPPMPNPINEQVSLKQQQSDKYPTAQEILQLVGDAIIDRRIDIKTLNNYIKGQETLLLVHDALKDGRLDFERLENFLKELKATPGNVARAPDNAVGERQPDVALPGINVEVHNPAIDGRAQGTKRRREE
jgi:hypothetical protein